MVKYDLYVKKPRPFKVTTDSKHKEYISPNLLKRDFAPEIPNQVWVGDITYISTKKGWLYLATVIDLYSRKVVGYSIADNLKTTLVNDALLMAIWQRKPKKGVIWHTDRGSQYASKNHRAILKDHKIIQSMSSKGDCWDNAVAESFFKTIKSELIYDKDYKNIQEAKDNIFEYIEVFYNRTRLHSNNNYLSPERFELQNA